MGHTGVRAPGSTAARPDARRGPSGVGAAAPRAAEGSGAPAGHAGEGPVRLVEEVFAARSRGEVKAAAARLEAAGEAGRAALCAEARRRGVALPADAEGWPAKRLVRACLDRAGEAQVLRNPIHRDEAFTCAVCGREVPAGGRRPRDHCPHCLWGQHVDVVPGDRAAACGGLLRPLRAGPDGHGGWAIDYRCEACGASRRNRVLHDLDPPDDRALVRALVARHG